MLVIRMRQQGALKNRQFRIVVVDQRARRDGEYIENLGWFNPQAKAGSKFETNLERIAHWVSLGARTTDRVEHLIKLQSMGPEKAVAIATKRAERKKTMKAKSKETK
jgi:small subunit ribosomal protein S16